MATQSLVDSLMGDIDTPLKSCGGVVSTPQELRENQFGLPLQHYAQQYLFGSTGLRLRVFHSISGVPQSCKSPLLFDLMGHICADESVGGLGGVGYIYELEDKISPVLLNGILDSHGERASKCVKVVSGMTIDQAFTHIGKRVIGAYKKNVPHRDIPIVIGIDSIGGAASTDIVSKMESDGAVGKGFHEKAHYVKYFCENIGAMIMDIPMVILVVNQEKEKASSTPGYAGPPQKQITGGVSQIFKDGHMISATYKTLASGDGKIVTLRTTKTSFSDARKIEVRFCWNKFGSVENYYGHHFDWALASAKCLADPEKGVGEIRDICDVKVSDADLVTCPQLGCRSVKAEEFEAALFANEQVLNDLYRYQKIDVIKTVPALAAREEAAKTAAKAKAAEPDEVIVAPKPKPKPKPKAKAKAHAAIAPAPTPEPALTERSCRPYLVDMAAGAQPGKRMVDILCYAKDDHDGE